MTLPCRRRSLASGVLAGRGAKFPAKYQQAIFAADWTFATLYAIHLTPDGTGFRATSEMRYEGPR